MDIYMYMDTSEYTTMAESEMSLEDVQGHFELKSMIFSFLAPFMLRTVVLLDIPNIIAKEGGSLSLEQIMSHLSYGKSPQQDVLQRILHFLVHKKVFSERIGEDGKIYYGLTAISKWLPTQHDFLLFCTHPFGQAAFQKVHETVLDGGYAYDLANGHHIWESGKYDPDYNLIFGNAMVAWSSVTVSLILEHYDGFKDAKTLVDVGGGLGRFAQKIAQKFPHVKVINFDLPHTISIAPSIPGVEHVSGNMFEKVPKGDTLIVKSILMNFNDDDCIKLLRNCYEALPKNGKAIVVELIYVKDAPFEVDLDMIMIGYTDGGKIRPFEQHKELLEKCGFSSISLKNVPSKEQVIEAYKL